MYWLLLIYVPFFVSASFFENGEYVYNYNNTVELLKMSHNAYLIPTDSKWYNTSLYNYYDIRLDNDSLQGYVFYNDYVNVIALKGTTISWLLDDKDNKAVCKKQSEFEFEAFSSISNDKFNDNLIMACCFHQQSNLFKNICEFNEKKFKCSNTCYQDSIHYNHTYFELGKTIIDSIKTNPLFQFDTRDTLFTGHSLGGTVSTLLGIYYDKTVVTFQSPGELHYIRKSMLFDLNKVHSDKIFHIQHTSDPIPKGDCGRLCSYFGYHIHTKCHIGNTCIYDSKNKLNISDSIFTHRSEYIINTIAPYWEMDMPMCKKETDCTECDIWEFI